MDGTQSPGINYNSIDGLTTVNATTISINGSTINLNSYIPYVGSVQAPDFNANQLKNIAIGTAASDAAVVSQIPSIAGLVPYTGATSNVDLNTKLLRNIGNATLTTDAVAFGQLASYVTYTGATTDVDLNAKQLKNIADATLVNDAISLQQLNNKRYATISNGAVDVYVNCGLINLTLQAGAIGKISIGSLIDCNSNKITGLAAGTNPSDGVRFDQLPTGLPAASVQGSYAIYNGTSYINNATNSINLGAYSNATATSSVNIGQYAGFGNTAATQWTINIGQSTGSSGQGNQTVAVGSLAGTVNQGLGAVAVGYRAQRTNVASVTASVSIGSLAGANDVGNNCVAVGAYAGYQNQADSAVAIGYLAGYTNQSTNSIIINATGSFLQSDANSALYIAPIRQVPSYEQKPRPLMYKLDTKEIVYNETLIFNVIIIGQAPADPNATVPLVYFMPTGVKVDSSSFTCTVTRVSQGVYNLTFPAASNPNFGTYTTITVGTNTQGAYTDIYMAKVTASNVIQITSVLSLVAYRDLLIGNNMSLRIEF